MHYVTESLVVGNLDDAQQPPPFVGGLLFVAEEHQIKPPQGIAYKWVPLKEFGEADPHDMKVAVDWLEQQAPANRLLICCRAGMGRSVSVVIAYLCSVKGMSYVEAVTLLKARRPGSTPLPNLEQTIEHVQRMRLARDHQGQGHRTDSNRTQKPAAR